MDRETRRALRHVVPHWRPLAAVLVLSLAGTGLALYVPYLAKSLVDEALLGRSVAALVRTIAIFGGITLATFALNVASGLLYTRTSADILFEMRLALYRHLQRLSPRFFARMPLGQIASRINSDIGEIQRVAAEVVLASLGSIVYLVGTVVILLALDPLLFAASLVLLPVALLALVRYRKRLERAVADVRDRSAEVGSFLVETLQGMKPVVAFNAQEREVERFRARNDAFVAALMHMRRLTYLSGGVPGLVLAAGSAVVFLFGGWRVINGAITVGTLVAFVAYQMRLFSPIQSLMGLYASVATARVSLKRVGEILDTPIEVLEAPDATSLPHARGALRLEQVTVSHDRAGAVLDDVSLIIEAGETVALVGPSGGGKSTMAELLMRHLDPERGRVLLDGQPLTGLRLEDVRRHVVVVDAEPFLFNASIAENIRFARPQASDAEVAAAAEPAGLAELAARLPHGLETEAGERGRALSSGERQRVAMARAFLAAPAVLVLDEATGALDPATEAEVMQGYERLMRGRTTVIITHRLALARMAGRIVVLENGRIVEEGAADNLLARPSRFARLFAQEPAAVGATA